LTSVLLIFQNDRVTSEKLDSLSLEELYAVSDRMGLDLPPGLERVFVIEEILDAMAEDSLDRRAARDQAVHVDEKKFSGLPYDGMDAAHPDAPLLGTRYNETMIRVLVRDPAWAFAYWDLSETERAILGGAEAPSGLFLRVAEIFPDGDDAKREYFDIPVADEDQQWYINVPRPGIRFRIDLCARPAGKFRILARSNEIESPRQSLQPGPDFDDETAELIRLSGLEDLHLGPADEGGSRRIMPTGPEGFQAGNR
jgi:hypothetical protein